MENITETRIETVFLYSCNFSGGDSSLMVTAVTTVNSFFIVLKKTDKCYKWKKKQARIHIKTTGTPLLIIYKSHDLMIINI